MTTQYRCLIEPLMNYTKEKFHDITKQKEAHVRLTYETIRQAISDLHGSNEEHKKSAQAYFTCTKKPKEHHNIIRTFAYHCDFVGISKELMLYIARNPARYVKESKRHSYDDHNDGDVYCDSMS